jgi:molybdenum cofactor cytidylyltransferase
LGTASHQHPENQLDSHPKIGSRVTSVHESIGGIILAAGGSERMGRPKQLLPWRGQPIIRHVVQVALAAGLSPVIVVLGAHADEIKSVLSDLQVEFVLNRDWRSGQSSSLQMGLNAFPSQVGAGVFLLADQPRVPLMLLRSLIGKHEETMASVIAPLIDGQRGNPVLFDRRTFSDLLQVQGDAGGRQLFSSYRITWVDWHDGSVLLDIDTEEDYQRLLSEDA